MKRDKASWEMGCDNRSWVADCAEIRRLLGSDGTEQFFVFTLPSDLEGVLALLRLAEERIDLSILREKPGVQQGLLDAEESLILRELVAPGQLDMNMPELLFSQAEPPNFGLHYATAYRRGGHLTATVRWVTRYSVTWIPRFPDGSILSVAPEVSLTAGSSGKKRPLIIQSIQRLTLRTELFGLLRGNDLVQQLSKHFYRLPLRFIEGLPGVVDVSQWDGRRWQDVAWIRSEWGCYRVSWVSGAEQVTVSGDQGQALATFQTLFKQQR
jgi:hypothetical protein